MSRDNEPRQLVNELRSDLHDVLGNRLEGLYLYGSLVGGDFDPGRSDVDLLAVTASDLDEAELNALERMHAEIVHRHPVWDNRVEVAYVPRLALQSFKTKPSTIAIISPGEPLHFKEAGSDWLINWYAVRTQGQVVFGPPPAAVIAPISQAEYLDAVQAQMEEWREWIKSRHFPESRPDQGYAIVTMCRGLYALRHGGQATKKEAARWAEQEFPEWAELIRNAFVWRAAGRRADIDHAATYPETLRFVNWAIDLSQKPSPVEPA